MSNLMQITEANFTDEVLNAKLPVLVDLWASWCGPCKMIEPTIAEIAKKYAGKLKVGKLNVDESPQLATNFGVRSIPTLLFFVNGKVKDQIVGAVPKKQIVSKIEDLLKS